MRSRVSRGYIYMENVLQTKFYAGFSTKPLRNYFFSSPSSSSLSVMLNVILQDRTLYYISINRWSLHIYADLLIYLMCYSSLRNVVATVWSGVVAAWTWIHLVFFLPLFFRLFPFRFRSILMASTMNYGKQRISRNHWNVESFEVIFFFFLWICALCVCFWPF